MPPTNTLLERAPITTSNVCNTPDCVAASVFIKQYINLNVDPCTDFFEYSCGAWFNAPPKKEKNTSRDSFTDIRRNNVLSLVTIMESSYDEFMAKHLKTNADGFNVVEQADTDRANFQKTKDYYNVCLHSERSVVEVYPDIAYIRNTLLAINTTTADSISKQLGHTLAYFTRQSASSLIQALTTRNEQDHDYNTAYISDAEFAEEDDTTIELVISRTLGQDNHTQLMLDASRNSSIQLWSQNEVKTAVQTYIDVQAQLKNISSTIESIEQSQLVINRNLSALISASSIIDWTTFFSDVVNPAFASNLASYVLSIPDFSQLLEELVSSLTLRELRDFFSVRFVMDRYSKGMIYPFMSIAAQANQTSSAYMYAENVSNLQAQCADEVGVKMYDSVGRFFALKTLGGINEKNQVDEFIYELQTSWLNHLPGTSWLDAATKARAVEKINALKPRAAINMINPDWTNPSIIKAYYEQFPIDTANYYSLQSKYNTWKADKQWKGLESKVSLEQWSDEGYASFVNAFYAVQLNQMEIPEGILQRIFYDATFPKYLNYGGLGTVIGHELTHALDDQGRLFNSTGYAENWWTPASNEAFHNRSQCFIDQYNKDFVTSRSTGENIYIDGAITLGENIADSGGLSIALTAYREYVNQLQQQEALLPDLSLTQEQMFFIGYTIPRCSYFDDKLSGFNPTDEHAPWSIRVKNSLINNAEFSKVFNCPAGSPMNPHQSDEDRCVIW